MAKKNEALTTTDDNETHGIVKGGDIRELIEAQGLSVARQVTLEKGDLIKGTFVGPGGNVEMDSKKVPGTKDLIRTWRIKSGAITWSVLGSAGLDKYLEPLAPGTFVAIQHMGTTKTSKGMNVNDFVVATGAVGQS